MKPYLLLCQLLGRDPIDRTLGVVPFSVRGGHNLLSLTENGRLRWYAASLVGGAAILLAARCCWPNEFTERLSLSRFCPG